MTAPMVQTIMIGGCQTLEDARENTRAFNGIAEGRKRLLLVDMKAAYSTAPGVRDYYASEEAGRCVSALAMMAATSTARGFDSSASRYSMSSASG